LSEDVETKVLLTKFAEQTLSTHKPRIVE